MAASLVIYYFEKLHEGSKQIHENQAMNRFIQSLLIYIDVL